MNTLGRGRSPAVRCVQVGHFLHAHVSNGAFIRGCFCLCYEGVNPVPHLRILSLLT
jgi:hypothetical protein